VTDPQQPESIWPPAAPTPSSTRKGRRTMWIVVAACGAVLLLLLMCCGGLAVFGAFAPKLASVSTTTPPPHTVVPKSASPTSAPTPATPSPTPSSVSPSPSSVPPSASLSGGFGLLQMVAWWDHAFPTTPADRCAAAGASPPIGTQHAWQLPNGGIACVDQGPNVWGDHIINIDIYFPSPVSEQQAVTATAGLMPPDAVRAATFDGVNASYSAKQNGSCRQVVFTSATLRTAVSSLKPAWTYPEKATIMLYSGNATSENGAEEPYDQRRVHLSSLSIGGENRGTDGVVHC
jgi:hypothetical protein